MFPKDKYYYVIARMFGEMYDKVIDCDTEGCLEGILERLRRYSQLRPGTYILYQFERMHEYNDKIVKYCPIIGAIDGKTIDVYKPNMSNQYDYTGQYFHYYPETDELKFT